MISLAALMHIPRLSAVGATPMPAGRNRRR
jgi:hypothetical protein